MTSKPVLSSLHCVVVKTGTVLLSKFGCTSCPNHLMCSVCVGGGGAESWVGESEWDGEGGMPMSTFCSCFKFSFLSSEECLPVMNKELLSPRKLGRGHPLPPLHSAGSSLPQHFFPSFRACTVLLFMMVFLTGHYRRVVHQPHFTADDELPRNPALSGDESRHWTYSRCSFYLDWMHPS